MTRAIQVRDVPESVHATLKARAATAGVSLSDYLRSELERVAARPSVAEVLERAASRHGGASSPAIVETIRAMRGE